MIDSGHMNFSLDDIPLVKQKDIYETITSGVAEFVKTKSNRCFNIYGAEGDGAVSIIRKVPDDGYFLFEVGGTYSKTLSFTYRTFLAKNASEAKARYKKVFGWDALSYRFIPPGEEAESVLTDPLMMPI